MQLKPASHQMPPRCRTSIGEEFSILLRGELFVLRSEWFWYLVQAGFVALTNLVFLAILLGRPGNDVLAYLTTGALVSTMGFAGMLSIGQQIGGLKAVNAFDYFAALPIRKSVFLAALSTRGVILTLPSVTAIVLIGYWFFGLVIPPVGWGVLILSAYALSGLGAIVGFWSQSGQTASLATQILLPVITLFAPVYYSSDVMPQAMRLASHLFPTTYAADALRRSVKNDYSSQFWLSLVVLGIFVLISLVLVPMRLDWRGRD